jgi:poly(A) polymerase
MGVLLHDVGKPPTFRVRDRIRFDGHAEVGAEMAARILERLKFSTADTDQIRSLVANHMRFKDVQRMRLSTLKRFLSLPRFEEHLELHRLDCLASNGQTASYEFVRQQLAQMGEPELRPARFISGNDLIAAGHKPGPQFAKALEAVETAQLEGEIHTREQALRLAEAALRND